MTLTKISLWVLLMSFLHALSRSNDVRVCIVSSQDSLKEQLPQWEQWSHLSQQNKASPRVTLTTEHSNTDNRWHYCSVIWEALHFSLSTITMIVTCSSLWRKQVGTAFEHIIKEGTCTMKTHLRPKYECEWASSFALKANYTWILYQCNTQYIMAHMNACIPLWGRHWKTTIWKRNCQ